MATVSLDDVLIARDRRVQRQMEWLDRFDRPLICFTLNIAGPVKVNEDTAYASRVGAERLLEGLKTMGWEPLAQMDLSSPAGHCLLLAVDAPAAELKRLCVSLEDLDELGRLFDLDVMDAEARKLKRETERTCLICGQPGRGCARARLHSVEQLQQRTCQIIQEHRVRQESQRIASMAVQSLLDEVCVTPKPGLVDCHDSGSHQDMDLFTFNASAAALYPYFQACYLAGEKERQAPEESAFIRLQALGLEAEAAMRRATGGVNTHKGAIYTLGVLCGAAGRTGSHELEPWLRACSALTAHRRAEGVRAEVADGLPSVCRIGLPVLQKARQDGLSFNDQCLVVLLHLLSTVRDTNMIARGGASAAKASRDQARALIRFHEAGEAGSGIRDIMGRLNARYVSENLSPGGCADLLAATLLVDRWVRAEA